MRTPQKPRWRSPPPEGHRRATSHQSAAAVKAMRLVSPGVPLVLTEVSLPSPHGHELLVQVQACGVCLVEPVAEPRRLGLYGFGAAAHRLAQVARAEGDPVFAFTRPGDTAGQRFARSLGAEWAGGSDERPGEWLDAAIVFAPVGALVPAALGCVRPGGRVVCAGIHMSDVPAFPYRLLWGERSVSSVANLTRADGR